MSREIDYFNARVRGMSGRLLGEELHKALERAPSVEAWTASLRETPYSGHLGPLSHESDIRLLYRAVDASIAERTHRLTTIASGRPADALRVCLAHWDLQNLLAVTSGIHHRARPMEILQGTLAGGLLGREQMEALCHCSRLREAADLLATWRFPYQEIYSRSIGRDQGKPLTEIRLELSRRFTEALLQDAGGTGYPTLVRFLRDRIDQTNLLTALMWRVLPSDRDPAEFFIQGGREVDLAVYRKILASADIAQAVDALRPGWLRKAAREVSSDLELEERFSTLLTALERDLIHRHSRPMVRDPMGIGLLIAFLL
ncbi:MAG: V-type ATPase subunit, partial [bacterium]